MSRHAEETLALIDEVAEAMDASDDRREQYRLGRQVVLDYARANPTPFVFGQAAKYLLARLDMILPQEQR